MRRREKDQGVVKGLCRRGGEGGRGSDSGGEGPNQHLGAPFVVTDMKSAEEKKASLERLVAAAAPVDLEFCV